MADFSRENIIKMLDYVDCNAINQRSSKRRDAYVTELYFENEILPGISKGDTTTGWCYVEQGQNRHWFKAFDNDDETARSTDREIV